MKVKMIHSSYMARKVATSLFNNKFIKVNKGIESITKIAKSRIEEDIQKEINLENKVSEMMDTQDENDEFEYMDIDHKQVFGAVKRRLAKEFEFELDYEDRYSNLSHILIDDLWKQDEIDYDVSDGIVKNIICDALLIYIAEFNKVEDIARDRISDYKRDLIPGSEDYNAVYSRIYEDELIKQGII